MNPQNLMTMANNCITEYQITSDTRTAQKLYKKLKGIGVFDPMNDTPLYKLAEAFSINYEKRGISVRGYIYHADYVHDKETDNAVITLHTDTAWHGCHDLFHAINHKLDDHLSVNYREVEPGCDIFYIHDECGFFPEECMVTCYGEPFEGLDGECFQTVEEAINKWCEQMDFDKGTRAQEEMLELIADYDYEDDDTYYHINVFTFE